MNTQTTTTNTGLTKRQKNAYARRAAKRDRNAAVVGAAFKSLLQGVEYTTNEDGDQVRVTTQKTRQECHEMMKTFLLGRRAYDAAELEEGVGTGWEKYMVQQGYVIEYLPRTRIYLLTTKAQKTYSLPDYLPCGMRANYHKIETKH